MKKHLKTTICAAALSICAAAQAALTDYTPTHWYKFDGNLDAESSTTALSMSSDSGIAYETIDGTNQGLDFSHGVAWGTGGKWTNGYSGNSYTFLLQLKSSGVDGQGLFGYGWPRGNKWMTCVGLYSGGTGIIVAKCFYNGEHKSSLSIAVPDAETEYHTYALVIAGDGSTPSTAVVLYVDGKKRGTLTTNGTNAEDAFCFGGVYGAGVNATSGGVGDFRFYEVALTAAEVAEYQIAMGGTIPSELLDDATHWYKFDGNLASSGAEALTFSGGTDGATYTTERKRTSLNISTTVAPSGSGLAYTSDRDSAYTFICCGKMSATDNTALWMTGNDANQYGGYRMGVYKGTGNNVVFAYTWYAKDGDIMASPLATAEIADISSKFHTYAIVKKATKDSDNKYDFEFYVDGVSVGTSTQFFDTLTDVFQFGAGYGKDAYKADGAELDDWRMFSRELSAEEIRQYNERFREHTGFVIIISDATLEVPTTWGGVSGMEEDAAEAALVTENNYGVKGYEAYLLGYDDIESANRVMGAAVSGGNVSLSFAGAGTPPTNTGVTVTYKAQYRESMTDGDWTDYPADSEDEHYVATSTDGTVSMAFANVYAYTRLVAEYE